ncbi:MAG: DUF3696 domain-containing protein [Candidatus Methanoperedens sp.]|nr:DUF3696 domain-containing protein [Candidatus Methanoperedens sp.]
MLETITLENFKGFKELPELKIKPITILCGTNSCGKSSILQSILLLKQTVESKNPNQTLLLNGRFVHLGTFENLIFEKKLENNIVFNFCFKMPRRGVFTTRQKQMRLIPFPLILKEFISAESFSIGQAEYFIHFKISLKTSETKNLLKPIIVDCLHFKMETQKPNKEIIPEANIEINLEKNELYKLRWENIHTRFIGGSDEQSGEATVKINFANLFPISIYFQDESKENRRNSGIELALHRLTSLFQNIFSTYTYIGPLREEPSRRYIYEDEIVEIGIKGENAAYICWDEQDKTIENHYFYDENNNSFFEKQESLKLSQALTTWLNLMKIKDLRPEPTNEIIYLNLNSSSAEKTRVSIADVGFGVSQIFPIVLEGLRMPKGNTLLLEQPEIHLHPNLQMQMADYFISLALSNKRVIVETHSDHIINRLVRRIVEDEKYNLKELIGIYFIKPTEKGSIYEEICIDDKRGITNWPNDFFDQTATEQEKILKAGLKKRKAEREKNL